MAGLLGGIGPTCFVLCFSDTSLSKYYESKMGLENKRFAPAHFLAGTKMVFATPTFFLAANYLAGPSRFERTYIRGSNVLETYFISPAGRATLTDLMPVSSEEFKRQHMLPDHEILRQVLCTEGEIKLEVAFCPRPYYGAKAARIHALEQGLRVDVGRGAYYLRSSVPIKIDGNDART